LEKEDLEQLEIIDQDEDALHAAEALRIMYSQINNRTKIIVGWSTIEELFRKSPEHLLSNEEKKIVIEKIKECAFDKVKEEKLLSLISNTSILSAQNRNELISKGISELLDQSYEEVYGKVRDLSQTRGKLAHTSQIDASIEAHIDFIESILNKYLKSRDT
jgi:hypothetical protein